jgi:hypothetical protein
VWHIIINRTSTKNRERILKAIREKKQIMYKDKSIKKKKLEDFSTDTLKARRAWSEVFQALTENNFSPRILYPAKLSFKIDRAIKIFHNKQKLKQYMTTKSPLQKILQGIWHTEDESKQNHKTMGSIKLPEKERYVEGKICNQRVALNRIHTQQKYLNGRIHHIPININSECQWTQLTYQKTPLEKLD